MLSVPSLFLETLFKIRAAMRPGFPINRIRAFNFNMKSNGSIIILAGST